MIVEPQSQLSHVREDAGVKTLKYCIALGTSKAVPCYKPSNFGLQAKPRALITDAGSVAAFSNLATPASVKTTIDECNNGTACAPCLKGR